MSRLSALLSLGAPLVLWAVQGCGASEASLRGAADAQRRLHDETLDSGNGTDDAPVVGSSSVDANLLCVDTPGWTNGWKRCNTEALGNDPRYCQAGGWTCEAYVAKGWCKNDRCLQPSKINGVQACGDSMKWPEHNCCACGKSPGPRPIVTYEAYQGRKAYEPYGATDIDTDRTAPKGLTVQQCQERCTADPQCSCVTFSPNNGKCWKRANCVESGWKDKKNFDVYMKITQSCLPENAECGGPGRRNGQCCAGSRCKRRRGSELKYCTPSSGQKYIKYFDKNAYYPYGATDIDDYFSAPTGLTAGECKDRCSADEQCSCVTQERSTGKCWKRANCNPSGWNSPHNAGYNVYMKQQQTRQSSSSSTVADVADSEPAANASEPLLYP